MALNRRSFLTGLIAAPVIVTSDSLMPVKLIKPYRLQIWSLGGQGRQWQPYQDFWKPYAEVFSENEWTQHRRAEYLKGLGSVTGLILCG